MTVIDFSFTFDLSALTFKRSVQACREAQDEAETSGCVCLRAASSASRRFIRASQGTRRAGMLGILFLATFLWPLKEKILAHEGRNHQPCVSTKNKKETWPSIIKKAKKRNNQLPKGKIQILSRSPIIALVAFDNVMSLCVT